jgi:hypothetical protein
LFKLAADGVELVKAYENEQVFTLASTGSELLVGVSGQGTSRVEVLDGEETEAFLKLPDVAYIWDLVFIDDKIVGRDELIIATGTEGKVLRFFDGAKEPEVVLDTNQSNVLSLAVDPKGVIYAGTDTDGLVYRIDRQGNPFVVYDAPEAEVSTLVAMPDGTVYAGTAAAEQARPGRLEQPGKEEEGRPDVEPLKLDKPEPQPLAQPEAPLEKAEDAAEAEAEGAAEQPAEEKEGEGENEDNGNDEAAGKPTPTKEQYDALRDALKKRLDAARESGQFDASADKAIAGNTNSKLDRPSRAKPATPQGNKKGNAIYQIAPDGFVAEVFRESVMILAIVPHDDKLIVATGNEGGDHRPAPMAVTSLTRN